eukprot:scaffold129309_cov18-Tisochrysis_lutea.AAC.1
MTNHFYFVHPLDLTPPSQGILRRTEPLKPTRLSGPYQCREQRAMDNGQNIQWNSFAQHKKGAICGINAPGKAEIWHVLHLASSCLAFLQPG